MVSELDQEYFGWGGNAIFITAQLFQLVHTIRTQESKDISYSLQILWIIGNCMYTTFGYLDNSQSLFIGSSISILISCTQLGFKIHFDRKHHNTVSEYQPILINEA